MSALNLIEIIRRKSENTQGLLNLTADIAKIGKSEITSTVDIEFGEISEIRSIGSRKDTHSSNKEKSQKPVIPNIEVIEEADMKKEDDSKKGSAKDLQTPPRKNDNEKDPSIFFPELQHSEQQS